MNLLVLRIVFFALIPIGVWMLVKAIQIFRKIFHGKVLLSIPFLQQGGAFSVPEAGHYSVWQKGPLLRRTPVDAFPIHIDAKSTHEEIKLNYSFLKVRVNTFSTGRMVFYTFYAPAGDYEMELKAGSNVSKRDGSIGNMIPLPPVDVSRNSIEIRQSQPRINSVIAIPMALVGFFGVIGGPVMGLLADQLFP